MHSEDEQFEARLNTYNTRGILKDRIPDLDVGIEGIETTSRSSLRITFIQDIVLWQDFEGEGSRFYLSEKVDDLLGRTSRPVAGLPRDCADEWEGILQVEPVQVGDELTMSGRFAEHVLDPVLRAILDFNSKKYNTPEQLQSMRDIPSNTIKIGSSRINPKSQRST
jgi:hypothetical protein